MHETHVELVLYEEALDTLFIKLVFLDLGEGRVQMLVERHRAVFRLDALGFGCIIVVSSVLLLERWLGTRLTVWETG